MFGLFVCFNLRKNEIQMGTHRVNFQSSIHLEFSVIFDREIARSARGPTSDNYLVGTFVLIELYDAILH